MALSAPEMVQTFLSKPSVISCRGAREIKINIYFDGQKF